MADIKPGGERKSKKSSRSRQQKRAPLYAAVDLGTNNCRLLIAARQKNGFAVIDSHSQIARLGEGLNSTGRLSDAAIERAMDALHKIARKLKAKKVGQVRCIATEACRQAENGRAFIERVREETGLTFKVISPREEAQLALVGCHDLIEAETEHVFVIDIGGGSTEVSLVEGGAALGGGLEGMLVQSPIKAWASLPVGVVTLTEAFDHLETDAEKTEAMLDRVRTEVSKWKRANQVKEAFQSGKSHIIGTSGTITCLTGVHMGLKKYRRDKVDGQWVDQEDMMAVVRRLREAGHKGRVKFPTIGEDRAGLMLAGCAIVEAIWELVPGARMRVADRGLREGLLLTMMRGPKRKRSRRRPSKTKAAGSESVREAGHGG